MNPSHAPATEATSEPGLAGRYPTALIDVRVLPDQRRLTLRPILPQDDDLLAALINRVSPATRQRRFPSAGETVCADQLTRLTCVDHLRHVAVVVALHHGGREHLVAEGRYLVDAQGDCAEFTLMVDDAWQRQGVATWVLQALGQAAETQGVNWLWCDVPAGNAAMLALLQHCRFGCVADRIDPRIVRAETRPRVLQPRRSRPLPSPHLAWLARWWPRTSRLAPVKPG